MSKIITVVMVALIAVFAAVGVNQLYSNEVELERREIELQDVRLELNEIKTKKIDLNERYEEAINADEVNSELIDKLEQEKIDLERQNQQLERDLQAKKQREAEEAEKLARSRPVQRVAAASTDCQDYRSLVAQYSWDVDTMMRAMRLESSCNPNAVGDQYVIGGVYAPSCGLLQVRTLPGRPSCEQLKDPAFNIATAYKIWQGQGYRAWTVLH